MTKNMETTLVNPGFTTRESRTFTKIGVVRTFEKDRVVLENCCLSEFLFIVPDGSAHACVTDVESEENVLAHYYKGDYFGGIEFESDSVATYIKTIEPCRFLAIRISEMKDLLPETNKFTKRIFENLLSEVEKKAHELSEVIQQGPAISAILSTITNSPTNLHMLLLYTDGITDAINLQGTYQKSHHSPKQCCTI